MAVSINQRFFIFTGGPGAGKSTVLGLMQAKGYAVVPEVARSIIQQQNDTGGDATHTGDQIAFCRLMLQASIKDYQQNAHSEKITFFDRGIPDLLGYARMIGMQDYAHIQDAIGAYRYNPVVFVFPPWQQIYQNDAERKQGYDEAVQTHAFVRQAYVDSGYQVIDVPKANPEGRVTFVLNAMAKGSNDDENL